ncbi:MAG: glutamine amidotransferase [Syntrophomonadaceae bacterium]|jgi:CobQ-like glutamine amidotransferase family enzyme|nr:glutamine amidotransferase [Syntrophomonadaceae bacterium]
MAQFTIAHLYPDLMDLYGDRGNLLCLKKRLEWRGHECLIKSVGLGEALDIDDTDMVFMGGGSDREQALVYGDLITRADSFIAAIEAGLPVLCVCGAYQMLGEAYIAADGKMLKGLGFFNFITRGGEPRLVGNVLLEAHLAGRNTSVVGFENHAGRTYLEDPRLEAFGRVVKGYGNNGQDGSEGIKYKNLIGTYLHGPLLPKNPAVADFFINAMAKRRGLTSEITPLDDSIENFAHQQVKLKILSS